MTLKIKPVEYGKIIADKGRRNYALVEVGDLVLLQGGQAGRKGSLFGIFADYLNGQMCFAEQPHRFSLARLPSGIMYPVFSKLPSPARCGGRVNYWRHYHSTQGFNELISGKDNIVQRLRGDSTGYRGFADVIEKMEMPYVNDTIAREKLGIPLEQ